MSQRLGSVSCAAALACLGSLLSPPPAAAQSSFPLTCRGGAKMTVRFQDENLENRNRFSFFFERASVGANESVPGPGQCAWLDRGLSADEPNRVVWTFKGAYTVLDVRGDGVVANWDVGGWFDESRKALLDLLNGIFEGGSFTLHVRAAGRGENRHFEVVRVGP